METIKRDFCNWLDHNIENEYKSHPNLFMKEEEKRLYIHIQEKGYTDEDPEDEGYYCIVEPFETKRVEDLWSHLPIGTRRKRIKLTMKL